MISPGECEARIQTAVDTQPGFKGRFTSNTLCTWEAGEDTCGGDSGGPLVTRGGGGSLELVGLTSWGPRSCAHSEVPPGRLHTCYFRPLEICLKCKSDFMSVVILGAGRIH